MLKIKINVMLEKIIININSIPDIPKFVCLIFFIQTFGDTVFYVGLGSSFINAMCIHLNKI